MAGESLGRAAVAELIGTFALVFVGAGSVVATANLGGQEALLTRALAHGLVVAVMVTATAHISGGHINPAVTIGLLVARKIKASGAAAYIAAQLGGAILAGYLLLTIYPSAPGDLGTPALGNLGGPAENRPLLGLLVELVLTFFLVFVVFATAVDPKSASKPVAGLAIGLAVGAGWIVGGNLTGAALNPARWVGPAVAVMNFDLWYVWWVGPVLGGVIAGALYASVFLAGRGSKS